MEKKLYRDEYRKMIGGVCAGLSEYLNVDVTWVRLLFIVLAVLSKGAGFIIYIVLLAVLPKKGLFNNPNANPGVDYTVPPVQPFSPPFGKPFPYPPIPKKKSSAGPVFGMILVVLGALLLIDQLDFIPDWDFDKLWPVMLVAGGVALVFAGSKKEPWKDKNWNSTVETQEPVSEEPAEEKKSAFDLTKKSDEPSNDNPTTI